MSNLLDFYSKKKTDCEDRTLEEMQTWSDWTIESSHTSIQWLFPLKEPSNFNPDAPLLGDEDIEAWQNDPVLQQNLRDSFVRFMVFLGLEWDGTEVKIGNNFNERLSIWEGFNHNWLRITRCLTSLRLLGLQIESDALYKRLQILYESGHFPIRDNTFKFWTDAVQPRA